MQIYEEIAKLQIAQDERLSTTLTEQSDRIQTVQKEIGTLNLALANLRRKSKPGSSHLDLTEIEDSIRQACAIYESLKAEYPHLIDRDAALFPLDSRFDSVEIEKVEEMMDVLANLLAQRQNEIPEITQMLKLATDLHEILSKIIQEMGKEHRKQFQTTIHNFRG